MFNLQYSAYRLRGSSNILYVYPIVWATTTTHCKPKHRHLFPRSVVTTCTSFEQVNENTFIKEQNKSTKIPKSQIWGGEHHVVKCKLSCWHNLLIDPHFMRYNQSDHEKMLLRRKDHSHYLTQSMLAKYFVFIRKILWCVNSKTSVRTSLLRRAI